MRRLENPPNPYASRYCEWLEPPPRVKVEVFVDDSRSILSSNDSPDIPFRWSVNPYRGCQHACAYCYARPTHEYLEWGAGTDFETRLIVKPQAPELLAEAFSRKSWRREMVCFSGVTDCYQPVEAVWEITRRCLEVCADYRTPVGIVTKSYLIVRDIDVLQKLRDRVGERVISSSGDGATAGESTLPRPLPSGEGGDGNGSADSESKLRHPLSLGAHGESDGSSSAGMFDGGEIRPRAPASASSRRPGVKVYCSIPFADDALARKIEPYAPSPSRRFDAMRQLHEAGIPVGVMVAPIIPALNDRQIPAILERAAECGASSATYTPLRLPGSVQEVFLSRLRDALPDAADHVEARIRDMRGGALNDSRFGARFRGEGAYWDGVKQLFSTTARRLGLYVGGDADREPDSSEAAVEANAEPAAAHRQLPLFG